MAAIGPVTLSIFDQPTGEVLVQVGYTVSATKDDATAEREYHEVVQLIGDETTGSTVDTIPGGKIWDGTVAFTTSEVSFTVTREATLPAQALAEDSGAD